MALGARPADIIGDALVRGGRLALVGIVVGIMLAAGLAQLMRTFLLDVSPFDPLAYASVAFVLMTISLRASFVPARRATMVDPLVSLGGEKRRF
jgi:putative ABC transport system permease protein